MFKGNELLKTLELDYEQSKLAYIVNNGFFGTLSYYKQEIPAINFQKRVPCSNKDIDSLLLGLCGSINSE